MATPPNQKRQGRDTKAINAAVRKDIARAEQEQKEQLRQAVAARSRPSRTEEQMTIDIIDAMATLSQLLKGRDLTPTKVQDALEDLVDNGDVFQAMRALMVNGGRHALKL